MKALFIGDKLNFGKYRGKGLIEVMKEDSQYMVWLIGSSPVKDAVVGKIKEIDRRKERVRVGMKVHCLARRGIYDLVEVRGDKGVLSCRGMRREGYDIVVPMVTVVKAGGLWNYGK